MGGGGGGKNVQGTNTLALLDGTSKKLLWAITELLLLVIGRGLGIFGGIGGTDELGEE